MNQIIRKYESNYVDYFPEEWRWRLKNTDEDLALFRKYRMRCSDTWYENADKMPFFDSIEKDANQFGYHNVEFADIFGIHWVGKKGCHHYVGEPDYERHLYYWDEEYEEMLVSDEYTQSHLPEGFAKIGNYRYYDIINIKKLKYHWILENHLFKDSHITVTYNAKTKLSDSQLGRKNPKHADIEDIWEVTDFALALLSFDMKELYDDLCKQVDVHFLALRDSEHSDERRFWPGKTADDYFMEMRGIRNVNKSNQPIQ